MLVQRCGIVVAGGGRLRILRVLAQRQEYNVHFDWRRPDPGKRQSIQRYWYEHILCSLQTPRGLGGRLLDACVLVAVLGMLRFVCLAGHFTQSFVADVP